MFGSHLSIAGGLYRALLSAEEFGFETVQVFTANPRSFHNVPVQGVTKNPQPWRSPLLSPTQIAEWKTHARRLGFKVTVSHASYLINLASPEKTLWRKSVDLFVAELSRCAALEIPYLVVHPGAHMGAGEAAGLARVVTAIDAAYERLRSPGVKTCLEITAGQGSGIGHRLEHLAWIIERVRRPGNVGVCLDTAHLFAAGYDFGGRKYASFIRDLDRIVGLDRVKVWHLNDSKRELGSRVDRHDHIGQGRIGLEGFRPIVRDRRWRGVPKIIETPKELSPDGREWDVVNIETLRGLALGRPRGHKTA